MKVLVVEPGYAPYEKDIEGLEAMQEVVGGLITASYPYEDLVAVVSNDESILLGMWSYGTLFRKYAPNAVGRPRWAKWVCSPALLTAPTAAQSYIIVGAALGRMSRNVILALHIGRGKIAVRTISVQWCWSSLCFKISSVLSPMCRRMRVSLYGLSHAI